VKRRLRIALVCLIALMAAASIWTRPRRSAAAGLPLLAGAQIEPRVLATLERACGDCHSEATSYPWYSYAAPVSWWIERHVAKGRLHLNLSRWGEYSLVRRERSLSEMANQVRDGDMPLTQYTLLHPDARLSEEDIHAIFDWTQKERARLIEESAAGRR
jgi:cytochrome c553